MPNESTGERLLAHRYRLVTQVGRGGMGTVWQAHDEVLGRDVAVKEVILPHGLTDEERDVHHKRTFREARTAARLGHPGVVTVYDVVEEDGRPWIVMELIHARSLDQVIKQDGPMESRRAAEIGRQMLAALHAAHDAGVLHRDVKPSNVLLTRGDRAILTDFGIATASGDATLTQTGLVMGSPAYIAPERARGRTAGPASDLWSLGVTLYAMVDGKSPFERSEPMAALVAIISEDPEPPAGAGRLSPVIEGLLRKNPDQRMDAIEAGIMLDEIVRRETVDTQRTLAVELPLEAPVKRRSEPEEPKPSDAYDDSFGTFGEHEFDDAYLEPPAEDNRTRVSSMPADLAEADRPGPAATEPAGTHFPPVTHAPHRPVVPMGRNILIVAAIVVILLIAIVSVAMAMSSGDKKNAGPTKSPSTKATQTKASSAPPTSAPPTSAKPSSPSVPAGFHKHDDKTGFSILVPDGWKGPKKRGSSESSVFFDAPHGGYIQVDQTSHPNPSALKDWEEYEPSARGRFPGYKKIKIAPVAKGSPISDPTGAKSADWEWTYDGDGGRMHGLNRGFVMNGIGYAIVLVTQDSGWDKSLADLAPVYEQFKPAD
ncbi:protein kinase [Actinomadura barringtoniae]|uniref:non-specific serine/threonine protein kinase n=1 Tax=Actinomadura barringtoniae TaxID=1427535 RepID=A0A939PA07_9ACTN|nr:serine/threonine-protein kinase [Actinomadura barringtoniae]MBO2448277.1 protein kinase [Actinomadura barringtoniae]